MPDEIKKLIEELGTSFEEHKKKNDERLAEIEKKGHADPLLEEQVETIAKQAAALAEMKSRVEELETKASRPGMQGEDKGSPVDLERKAAVVKYLRKGESALSPDEIKLLSSDSNPDGGYLVESEMSDNVITAVNETSPIRPHVTVETISSDALEIPEDIGKADAGWTSERGSKSESNTPQLGVRRIPLHELYSMPKATQILLDDSKIDIEAWLEKKIAEEITVTENAAFINGDGSGKPRGLLTYPTGSGVGKVLQINSGNATALTADGIRKLFYGIKAPYAQTGKFFMARTAVEKVALLKDGNGQYIWHPGMEKGDSQTLMGAPLERMEDMPAVAANSLSVAFGDFKRGYTVIDRAGLRVLRDPLTQKGFILFYTTKRTGGDVTNFEAFAIQKTAA